MSDVIERTCEAMHDAYEAAAVENGWATQERSRKPWADVPEANKATMRAAVRAALPPLLADLRALHREVPVYEPCTDRGCERDDCDELARVDEYVHFNVIEGDACAECRGEDGELVWWPCDTAKALYRLTEEAGR